MKTIAINDYELSVKAEKYSIIEQIRNAPRRVNVGKQLRPCHYFAGFQVNGLSNLFEEEGSSAVTQETPGLELIVGVPAFVKANFSGSLVAVCIRVCDPVCGVLWFGSCGVLSSTGGAMLCFVVFCAFPSGPFDRKKNKHHQNKRQKAFHVFLPSFGLKLSYGYTLPVTSKKGVIGIGVPKTTAARSRRLRRSCGFIHSGPQFYGGPNVGPQGHRLSSSAVVPARQPVRAAAPIGVEVAVVQRRQLEPSMANTNTRGASAPAISQKDVEHAAASIAHLGHGALNEIAALCTVALAAMETSGACEGEDLALLLQVMHQKASDIANCIDYEALQINLMLDCPRATKRRAARNSIRTAVGVAA